MKFSHWTLHCRDLQRGAVTRIAVTNTTESGRVQGVLPDGRRTSRPARECYGQYPTAAEAAEVQLSIIQCRRGFLAQREQLSVQKEQLRTDEVRAVLHFLRRMPT